VRHFEQFSSMFHVLSSWLLVVHVGLAGKAALLCAGRSVVVPGQLCLLALSMAGTLLQELQLKS
jgi:hypothetical protein